MESYTIICIQGSNVCGWGSVLPSEFLGIVEDGGEMVFISVYAALVFGMFAERPH